MEEHRLWIEDPPCPAEKHACFGGKTVKPDSHLVITATLVLMMMLLAIYLTTNKQIAKIVEVVLLLASNKTVDAPVPILNELYTGPTSLLSAPPTIHLNLQVLTCELHSPLIIGARFRVVA